jgi:hypothetical protein
MSQIIFSRLHLKLSNNIGDTVTDYQLDGKTILASKRTQALNDAIRFKYETILAGYLENAMKKGEDAQKAYQRFADDYPAFRTQLTVNIVHTVPNSRAIPRDENVRRYLGGTSSDNLRPPTIGTLTPFLNEEQYRRALTVPDSNFKPTATEPRFWETLDVVKVEIDQDGTLIADGSLKFNVLINPIDTEINVSVPDVVVPNQWESEIISLASQICLSYRQG